ncbi:MAG: hypothetical protein K6V73_08030, partial [Firmicutes bacterium]|nr:hypothetical protein [Bacillota bacterium]
MTFGKKQNITVKVLFALADLALINAGYLLAYYLRFGLPVPAENLEPYLLSWPWLTLTSLGLLYLYRFYAGYRWRWAEVFAGILCVVFFQALAAIAIAFYLRGFAFPRTVLLLAPFVHLVLLSAWRRFAWHLERRLQGTGRVLVVGRPAEAAALAEKLEDVSFGMIRVAGVVTGGSRDGGNGNGGREGAGPDRELHAPEGPVLGDVSAFCECLDAVRPDGVFICAGLPAEEKAEVLYA